MAALASPPPASVVPAQLGFLAIFNPSLGITDDTLDDQIVYYASVNTQTHGRRHRSRGKPIAALSQAERNERLRQIGLAQGMVEFSRGFSGGQTLNTIDTDKSRCVLHELEPGWWILASVDLNKIPLPPRLGSALSGSKDSAGEVEYSSREMKPAALLLQDLLRAHSTFLLHHTTSLSAMFVKLKRTKFISVLTRFWDLFLSTWNMMLHGNPAVNVFGGIKVAACGELGVGVGEEHRGSGEREVLEGFVGRVEGLTDLIVSKFGSPDPDPCEDAGLDEKWLGTGDEPAGEDGAVFLGVGAISKRSVCDITQWMEDLYSWGEDAYGVKDRPSSVRQARKERRNDKGTGNSGQPTSSTSQDKQTQDAASPPPATETPEETEEGGVNKLMSYLKMGYGTHWSVGGSTGPEAAGAPPVTAVDASAQQGGSERPAMTTRKLSDNMGHYLIGLLGDVDEESGGGEEEDKNGSGADSDDNDYNSRVLLRTVVVELNESKLHPSRMTQDLGSQENELLLTKLGYKDAMDPSSHFNSQDRNMTQKMRVVVYVSKPFIYTFLFQNRTDSLAWNGLYRSLHHQLEPLKKQLIASTAYRPERPDMGQAASQIYDLVWDPNMTTVHSTIPNIPDPGHGAQDVSHTLWTRAEALSMHNQILNIYTSTLTDYSEVERTCKTNRGWWVVWMRIPSKDVTSDATSTQSQISTPRQMVSDRNPTSVVQMSERPTLHKELSNDSEQSHQSMARSDFKRPKPRVDREIFLIRRAGENGGLRGITSVYSEDGGWGDGAARLAQGIGVDARQYVESLLNLQV
ncbi:vacuolar fusion protein CCZ1 [Microdochium nivale]|nr:vacuolar fusion protein CCZ1 [Microdochium nivale]